MPAWLLPAVGATLGGAGLVGSFLNKPNYNTPDISGELKKISELFAQMRAQAETSINRQAALGRAQSANSLAARGVYSSPVSEHTFNRLEDSRLNSIADANAQIGGQEANARSSVLGTLLQLNARNQDMRNQANAARWGSLTGLGANLGLMGLSMPNASPAPAATGGVPDWRQLWASMNAQPSNYVMR